MWGGFQGFDQLKANEVGKVRAAEIRAERERAGRPKRRRFRTWLKKRREKRPLRPN